MGSLLYNGKDRTRLETIFKQNVGKEKKYHRLNKTFQMNLVRPVPDLQAMKVSHNRIECITEKEIAKSPLQRANAEDLGECFEVSLIRHLAKSPSERWAIPESTTHEMGWLLQRPMRSETLGNLLKTDSSFRMSQPSPTSIIKWKEGLSRTGLSKSETLLRPMRRINLEKWRRPKSTCDVTTYSDRYVRALQISPFSNLNK